MKEGLETWRVHLALLGVQVTFGIYPVLARWLLQQMSPFTLASIRVLGATLVFQLLLWARARAPRAAQPLNRRDFWLLGIGGVLGIALNQLLYVYGLSLTSAMTATWISGSIPVFTLLIAALRGVERPVPINWLGVLLAFTGCLYLVGWPAGSGRDAYMLGSLYLVAGCIVYSSYLVLLGRILQRLPTVAVVAWTFTFGAPVILALGWPDRAQWLELSPLAWLGMAAVILLPTVVAYLLNNWALGRARPSLVASYINVQPVLVAVLAVFLLGERLSGRLALSGLLIFAGVYCASRRAHLLPSPVE